MKWKDIQKAVMTMERKRPNSDHAVRNAVARVDTAVSMFISTTKYNNCVRRYGEDDLKYMLFTPEFKTREDGDSMKNDDGSYAEITDEYGEEIRFTWTKEKRDKAIAAQLLLKRLTAYTVFTSFAFTVLLFPFYQGEGYAKIVKDAAEAALPGMRICLLYTSDAADE